MSEENIKELYILESVPLGSDHVAYVKAIKQQTGYGAFFDLTWVKEDAVRLSKPAADHMVEKYGSWYQLKAIPVESIK